jgi:hypothetical protein
LAISVDPAGDHAGIYLVCFVLGNGLMPDQAK